MAIKKSKITFLVCAVLVICLCVVSYYKWQSIQLLRDLRVRAKRIVEQLDGQSLKIVMKGVDEAGKVVQDSVYQAILPNQCYSVVNNALHDETSTYIYNYDEVWFDTDRRMCFEEMYYQSMFGLANEDVKCKLLTKDVKVREGASGSYIDLSFSHYSYGIINVSLNYDTFKIEKMMLLSR